ncbi:hypothetical protein EDB89DRAFT_953281 [Lactarius sanguifluus]|nr:hypothetical protein EDB89DRAFT_953281 [Lactarius sanguifluus]
MTSVAVWNIHATLVYPIAIRMMFMRTILALSLAAFALAVPVAQPQDDALLKVIADVEDDLDNLTVKVLSREPERCAKFANTIPRCVSSFITSIDGDGAPES